MSDDTPPRSDGPTYDHGGSSSKDPNPPTFAAFAPPSTSKYIPVTVSKSSLLVATPPQVTRVLSQSYPYVSAANAVFGLLTWTAKDPWESFLLVAAFWGITLYGDYILRYAGIFAGVGILGGLLLLQRWRFDDSHLSLDDIVECNKTLTTRLNIFFQPCFNIIHFISTRRSSNKIDSKHILVTLLIRCLFLSPAWFILSVYPFRIITSRRIILTSGTLVLTWHSRPAKVTRTILWRSRTVRRLVEKATGVSFAPAPPPPSLPPRDGNRDAKSSLQNVLAQSEPKETPEKSKSLTLAPSASAPGVKFTFVIYENQRRWIGVGWTSSLFAYERAPWTDEHLQPCAPPDEFELPECPPGSGVKWRWVEGEDWRVDGASNDAGSNGKKQEVLDRIGGDGAKDEGWIYYDNKWKDGKRGADGWGKYTRRRKWYRAAELVEDHDEPKIAITKAEPTIAMNPEKVGKN